MYSKNLISICRAAKAKKLSDEDIKNLNELYAKSHNMNEVARQLNIAPSTVKRHLTDENKVVNQQEYDDRDALFFYIYRLFGQYSEDQPVSSWNIVQMQKFKDKGISYKAQLLTLKYFYEIKHNSTAKSNGSIGIIPYIITESRLYYEHQDRTAAEISAAIQRQLEKDRIEIKINPSDYISRKRGRSKKLINLSELE